MLSIMAVERRGRASRVLHMHLCAFDSGVKKSFDFSMELIPEFDNPTLLVMYKALSRTLLRRHTSKRALRLTQ